MSQQILHKRSNETVNGMAKTPAASGLSYGEIAINYNAGTEKIFIKNSNNEVISFGTDKNSPFEPGTGANSAILKGDSNSAGGARSIAEGYNTTASGSSSHAEGSYSIAGGNNSHAEGEGAKAYGTDSHAEGDETIARGQSSHAEGNETVAIGSCSHAEGSLTKSFGNYSHAEGQATSAITDNSHSEGYATIASGNTSHAEGEMTAARGDASHTEGGSTVASDYGCHAEGYSTVASGYTSHAEGQVTLAKGLASHAEGERTTAENESEHAEGRNNVSNKASETYGNSGNTQHSVGIGTSPSDKKNAFEIMQNGDAYLYGVGGYDGTNASASTSSTLQQVLSNVGCLTEITWSELKTLRDSSGLTPGMQYRITDYNTTTVQSNTQAAGHQFDIIVVADDDHTLNENARAIRHSGDTYFSGSTLEAWELKYDIDNDTNKYAWADSGATGRGVIYYMKDEWNNECPYDFKNIQFARWEQTNPVGYIYDENQWDYVEDSDQSWVSGYNLKAGFYSTDGSSNDDNLGQYKKKISYTVSSTPTYCYTFGRGLDASLGKNVYGNVIKEYHQSNKLQLNNIVFLQTTLTQNCRSNTFGNDCEYNTFGNNCQSNTFGKDCSSNTFGNNCEYNTFGNNCGSNTFGNDCEYNTFGSNCEYNTFRTCGSNTFGNNCQSNTFGNNCQSNTFGNNCFSNTFGDYGQSNIFGNNCQGNTFGNYSHSNTFGNSCSYNTFGNYSHSNTFGNSCQNNAFGNNCESNTFGESVQYFITGNATGATTSAQTKDYIRCLIVENGVRSVNAYCTGTTSDSNYCQNIKIGLGLKGARSSNRLQINITSQIGATASVTYQPTGSQTINI